MKKWILGIALLSLLSFCSHPTKVTGGSTTTDNAKVTGSVYYADGGPAKGASVRIREKNYVRLPGAEPDSVTRHDTVVNDSGRFIIDSLNRGEYRIEVNDLISMALMLRCSVATEEDSIPLPSDTLKPYTAIAGKVDSARLIRAPLFVQLYGTDRLEPVDSATGAFSISDLPPAMYTVRIAAADTGARPVVIDSVITDTGVTQVKIDTAKIDTTPSLVMGPWTPANGPYVSTVKCIAVSPSGDIFAGTNGGGAYRSVDHGATWTTINTGLSNSYVQCLAVGPSGNSLYAGTQNELFLSADNGASWTAITNHLSLRAIMDIQAVVVSPDGSGGAVLFAGTKDNGIFKSVNNGASWTVINTGDKLTDVTYIKCLAVISNGAGQGIVFAGTYRDGVFRSDDNGSTWTQVNTGLTDLTVYCLTVSPDGKKLFAGGFTGVFVSADSGANWTLLPAIKEYTTYINAIAVIDNGAGGWNIFAASYSIGVFLSIDSGANWTKVNTGFPHLFVNALAISGADVFAGADYDGMFISQNNGATWIGINNGLTNVDVTSFATSGPNLFAGTSRGIFLSADNGLSWKEIDSGLTNLHVATLAVMKSGAGIDNLFSAVGGDAFMSTDNGSYWKGIDGNWSNPSIEAFAVVGATLFAGADNGGSTVERGIFMTNDMGATWTPASIGLTNIDSMGVVTFAVDSNGPGPITIFAGTNNSGIFRSTDMGASWAAVNNGLTTPLTMVIHCIAVGPTGTNRTILMAGTDDSLFISTNSGDSWTAANTGLPAYPLIKSFAVVPKGNGGSYFFTATGGGPLFNGIYLSTDNGASWTAVNTGLPNNWIYALIVKDNYLFAGLEGKGVWKARIQ